MLALAVASTVSFSSALSGARCSGTAVRLAAPQASFTFTPGKSERLSNVLAEKAEAPDEEVKASLIELGWARHLKILSREPARKRVLVDMRGRKGTSQEEMGFIGFCVVWASTPAFAEIELPFEHAEIGACLLPVHSQSPAYARRLAVLIFCALCVHTAPVVRANFDHLDLTGAQKLLSPSRTPSFDGIAVSRPGAPLRRKQFEGRRAVR
jgi:hypothetical protein